MSTAPAIGRDPIRWPANLWRRYEWAIDHGYPATPSAMAFYRIAFAAYVLAVRPLPPIRWIAAYPDDFYAPPPGLAQIWGGSPSGVAVTVLAYGVLLAAALLLVGWRTPWTSLSLGVMGILANSAYFSFGKIEHTILVWVIPIVFSFSGWGAALSLDQRSGRGPRSTPTSSSRAIFSLGVMLAIAFCTAAVPKILSGWLSFDTSMTKLHFVLFQHQLERDQYLSSLFARIDSVVVWEAIDWATVLFESAIVVTILWPVVQRRMALVAWVFHLSVLLIMNIGFVGTIPVYPAFFLPLLSEQRGRVIAARVQELVRRPSAQVAGALLLAFTVATPGIWPVVTQGILDLHDTTRDLILFGAGFVALLLIAVKTGGYRAPQPLE